VEFDFADEFMPEFDLPQRPEYFELWLADGTLIERSRSLGKLDLPRANSPLGQPNFSDLTLLDGRVGRLVEVRFVPHMKDDADEEAKGQEITHDPATGSALSDIQAIFAVAKGREDLDDLIFSIRTIIGLTLLTFLVATGILVRVSLERGLKPLKEIARDVRGLDVEALSARVQVPESNEELRPIANQLNHLLERLDQAFQREKRFSENVAHELRTPIAELRTLAEVGGGWPEDQALVTRFFGRLVKLSESMESTVTNLLMLARCDAGKQTAAQEKVDLREITEASWQRVVAQAGGKDIRIDNRISSGLYVNSDKYKLTLVLFNLFSNAVAYSPPHSDIVVLAAQQDDALKFSVSNRAVDLDEEDLKLMFERFWRKDQARTGGQHAGLGLSLVKALTEVLNLEIRAWFDTDHRFTMTLSDLRSA
jgi:two-component system sensor histidine kinase QseC